MSRTLYAPKHTYIGNGTLDAYTFDFKIEVNTQLEVVVMDDSDVEIERVRGDDTVYLSSVVFDSVNGGGTVNLQANLPSNYDIIILLANDAPTQDFQFSNKLSFNLKRIEAALDFVVGAVMRLAYRSKQSLRIHDSEDEETFDTQLPPDILGNADKFLKINEVGDGFEYGEVNDPVISAQIDVIGVSQGQYNDGDTIVAGTDMEEILRNMLKVVIPPTLTLAGDGSLLVESGTLIGPTLTPTWTQNDAGAESAYELRRDATPIYNGAASIPQTDGTYNIVDESKVYEATTTYLDGDYPAGSIISNTVTYTGARAAFFQVGGDKVNIRTNSETLVGVQAGSQLITIGDDVSLDCVFAYPDSLGAPTSLFLSNTGGNFDITSDLVAETSQMVDDANASNPILYRVYSYTALIPIKITDTLTLTI